MSQIKADIAANPNYWLIRHGSGYTIRVGPKFGDGNYRIEDMAKLIRTKYESGDIENISIKRLPAAGRKALNYLLGLPIDTTLIQQDEVVCINDLRRYLTEQGVRQCSVYDVYAWLVRYGQKDMRRKAP